MIISYINEREGKCEDAKKNIYDVKRVQLEEHSVSLVACRNQTKAESEVRLVDAPTVIS